MNYIFNASGKCVARCSYEPNMEDLATRGEIAFSSDTTYELDKIQLVNGVITEITTVLTEAEQLMSLKAPKLSSIRTKLSSLDYKCLKYVDGDLSESEYALVKLERHNLRVAYNSIESATTPEEVNSITYEI